MQPPPILDEILRARLPVREDVFKKWQQELRKLRDALQAEHKGTQA